MGTGEPHKRHGHFSRPSLVAGLTDLMNGARGEGKGLMGTETNNFFRGTGAPADRLPIRIDAGKQPDRLKKIEAKAPLREVLC